ncbi:hypothetical protein SteCoe_23023 [Stentor coeruleus]|uniref:Uncharacterized protein n=1 Tax=Stentor coeruleus TaxID=5963 RepID=A0A1R2BKT1_9CILI|nr:hypothetical protein SteCoe_23023 [Stentor coeruleus]
MAEFLWIFLCVLLAIGGFFYGKHIESTKTPTKKYSELGEEELEEPKDLKLFKEEPKDSSYLKEELKRERETKRKLVEQYEYEITYLKSLVSKNQANFDQKLERHEKTQKLFEEMSSEMGPIVQIVDSGNKLSDDEFDQEINLNSS